MSETGQTTNGKSELFKNKGERESEQLTMHSLHVCCCATLKGFPQMRMQ